MPNLKALRPNVGFLLAESPGYTRVLEIDLPTSVQLGDDLALEWLRGELRLTRNQQGIWLDGRLRARLPAECARCLETLSLKLDFALQEMFYYPPSRALSSTDYVIQEDGNLDLVEPIRERLVLEIPIRIVCRPDCRGLCDQCGQNLNLGSCDCREEQTDPRLANLLKLKQQLDGG